MKCVQQKNCQALRKMFSFSVSLIHSHPVQKLYDKSLSMTHQGNYAIAYV